MIVFKSLLLTYQAVHGEAERFRRWSESRGPWKKTIKSLINEIAVFFFGHKHYLGRIVYC